MGYAQSVDSLPEFCGIQTMPAVTRSECPIARRYCSVVAYRECRNCLDTTGRLTPARNRIVAVDARRQCGVTPAIPPCRQIPISQRRVGGRFCASLNRYPLPSGTPYVKAHRNGLSGPGIGNTVPSRVFDFPTLNSVRIGSSQSNRAEATSEDLSPRYSARRTATEWCRFPRASMRPRNAGTSASDRGGLLVGGHHGHFDP